MTRSSLARYAPLAGVVFFVLFVVAVILFPDEPPDTDDTALQIVRFWKDNEDGAVASSFIFLYAMIAFLWSPEAPYDWLKVMPFPSGVCWNNGMSLSKPTFGAE